MTKTKLKCSECGAEMSYAGSTSTYVSYISPSGHNHDDNCVVEKYICKNGHHLSIPKRKKCPNPNCDWVGTDYCSNFP